MPVEAIPNRKVAELVTKLVEVKLFFRIQYIVQYIGFISFIACPILAYRLLVISGLIS